MAPVFEQENRRNAVREAASRMMMAARTAPKARGIDNLIIAAAERGDMAAIADKMAEMAASGRAAPFFARDAENIRKADGLVLIGTRIKSIGLALCGLCGHKNCATREAESPDTPCAFNTGDLGIAVGSAVSVAADMRIDNRVMYSVGIAARELGLLGPDASIIYGIPLSAGSKNPFFDRSQTPGPQLTDRPSNQKDVVHKSNEEKK